MAKPSEYAIKANEKVVMVPIVQMEIGGGTQCRAQGTPSGESMRDMIESLKDPDERKKVPPVILYEDADQDGRTFLGDGFRRRAAAMQIGMAEFPAVIRKGSRFEALKCNAAVNKGQVAERWTRADRRNAVKMIFGEPQGPGLSDRLIADLCGVSEGLVGTVRAEVEQTTGRRGPPERTGQDGRKRPAAGRKSGKSGKGGAADEKPGSVKVDWHAFHAALGVVIRLPDEIAAAYPEEKDGHDYTKAQQYLAGMTKLFRRWEERIQKVEKESASE